MHSLIFMAVVPLNPAFLPTIDDSTPATRPAFQQKAGLPKKDMVLRWNDETLDAIRESGTPPPLAARNLAIVHTSMFDAVNAIVGTHAHYFTNIRPLPGASPEAAAASAAHRALIELYPRRRERLDRALDDSLAEVADGDGKAFGKHLGLFTAERILAWRGGDGADRKATYDPQAAPGVWQRTPPDFAEPLLPHWPEVRPFAMDKNSPIRPKDPPRLSDAAYVQAFNEVKELGNAKSKVRTKDQTEIALFWADGAGTSSPPGHWNRIAQTVALDRGTTLAENARLFALLNVALADAGILCWDCKYKMSFWRPVTAIRNADQADNADLAPDREWMPLIKTPPFPSYTSGHSTFSGAAATVLADFFGDKLRFQSTSEGLPGVTRSFNSFWEAAREAGRSRIYGGIHWEFDNAEGLAMGKTLGHFIGRSYMVAINQPRIPVSLESE
jgi:hypothetical protein